MNFAAIIDKKKHNKQLTNKEIEWVVQSFVNDSLKDYQMAAFNMAVWFNGMSPEELATFTKCMIDSGITYDLSGVAGPFADKHSTGGVGDKTSLIFAPLVAHFGVKVSKLSGRGLGQTGGTIDKLESCTGWTGEISETKFKEILNKVGISIMSQSSNVVPADKKLYALRDVTGTVDSIPLIASSIMSKKLVVPADSIVLDVKVGSGAFMKTVADAKVLAKTMIEIGHAYKRNVSVLLTNMDKPLGRAIGNALEVKEAWETLQGKGPEDLNELCITAAALTLVQTKKFKDLQTAQSAVKEVLMSGQAAHYLQEFVEAQGGNFDLILNYDKNFTTKYKIEVCASSTGYLRYTSAADMGYLSMHLGAGRATKEDKIDFAAGIYLNKQPGDFVNQGEVILTMYTNINDENNFKQQAEDLILLEKDHPKDSVILELITE